MKKTLFNLYFALAAALLFSACANQSVVPERPDRLPSAERQQDRITDRVITIDRRYMSRLRERMLAINSNGVAANNYHLSKADAWLDFATEEYANNDRSGIVERVLEQTVDLIRGLESRQTNLSMSTPIILGSRKIREDLWQRIQQYKAHESFVCVAGGVARLEVQLVWAGHEDIDGGWRNARPYIEIAEEMADKIELALERCERPTASGAGAAINAKAATTQPAAEQAAAAQATAVQATASQATASQATAPPPATAALLSGTVQTKIALSADALFRFGGAARADLLSEGLIRIDDLIARLKRGGSIDRILITGHTDRLGDSNFNLRLSEQRALTLRQLLIERGFSAELVQAAGAGESEPLVTCSGDRADPALIDCLQPNRRVEVRVLATPAPAPLNKTQ